jgi:hypothetical protein
MDFDLELAYERVVKELRGQPKTGRVLIANPFEIELAEVGRSEWLAELGKTIETGKYAPGPIEFHDAPKGGGLVRPATQLGLADRIVYTAAVGACLPRIYKALSWTQGATNFAPRLDPAHLEGVDWLRSSFKGWKEFRERSLQRMSARRCEFVLTADIAGFFENVSLQVLRYDLERLDCDAAAVDLVTTCLNAWATCPGRGLPQGVEASDVLAALYLEPFDERMRAEGMRHMRYVDDIRVFATSEPDAQRSLIEITRTLRERGLSLQSAKTKIRPTPAVVPEIDGVIPAIQGVKKEFLDDLKARGIMSGDVSLPMSEIDEMGPDEVDAAVIRKAFDAATADGKRPAPSLLRFLLNRLGPRGDYHAVEHCTHLLEREPQHTPEVLRYFEELVRRGDDPKDPAKRIVKALRSRTGATYPYQRYLLLDWIKRVVGRLPAGGLRTIRRLAFAEESPPIVQAKARELLSQFGSKADLDKLANTYKSAAEPLVRAQALSGLRRLDKGQRNSLAGRAARSGGLVARAAKYVRVDPGG